MSLALGETIRKHNKRYCNEFGTIEIIANIGSKWLAPARGTGGAALYRILNGMESGCNAFN